MDKPVLNRIEDLISIWDLNMDQEYIVDNLIPEGAITLITGESGHGKSSVVLALAYAVATGTPFLGHSCKQRKVLFVDGENGLQVYHERFKRFGIKENFDMYFWGLWNRPEPTGPDSAPIIKFADEHLPLIIFDSLIAFHPGSEQDSRETRSYMDGFRRLANGGATVIVIHHTGKGESTHEYRGSSDIKASVDAAYLLTSRKPLLAALTLRPYKSREGALEVINFGYKDGVFSVANSKSKLRESVEEFVGKNPNLIQQDIVKAFPDSGEASIRRILEECSLNGTFSVEKGNKNASHYFLKSTSEPK